MNMATFVQSIANSLVASSIYATVAVGLYLRDVVDGTAASKAGLQAGDVLLSIGDIEIAGKGRRKLMAALRKGLKETSESGKPAPMKIIRKGETLELTLELESPDDDG